MGNVSSFEKINSLMIAIILTSGLIARIFASIGILDEGLVPILFILALTISYTSAILTKSKMKIEKNSMIFIYFILIIFVLTLLFRGINSYAMSYFIEFLFYGMIAFLLSRLKFSPLLVIYLTMLIGNVILINPVAFKDYISLDFYYDSVSMGATYSMLPSIAATILHFLLLRKIGNPVINIISYISNFFLLYLLITEGSRGAVLAIVLLLMIVFYIKLSKKMEASQGQFFFYFISLVFGYIIVMLIVNNIEKLLYWVDNYFYSKGIEIAAITKTINMVERHGLVGIFNARDRVYERGIDLFHESPIWGHGIGSYADVYWGTYPHNLFLQLLVEGGILFTIPFAIILINLIWILLRPWIVSDILFNDRIYILFLFVLCIPRLMVSSYLWKEQSFWLLIFAILTYVTKRKVKSQSTNIFSEKYNRLAINKNHS